MREILAHQGLIVGNFEKGFASSEKSLKKPFDLLINIDFWLLGLSVSYNYPKYLSS
jgi:hypothetical protein